MDLSQERNTPPEEMPMPDLPASQTLLDGGVEELWLGAKPRIPESTIKAANNADVVIIGAGIAGLCAARAASEEGASVILVEKSTHFNARSGFYAVIGGKINEYFGRPSVDPDEVTDRIMQECQYRIKRPIISRWSKHAHEVFDWYISAMPELYIARTSAEQIPSEHKKCAITPCDWPGPEAYDYRREAFPVFPTSLVFSPGHAPLLKRTLAMCTDDLGVKVYYAHKAEQLITDEDRVSGVLIRDMKDGGYVRLLADKGVILATGDNGGNPEILRRFYPSVITNCIPVSPGARDAEGKPINTGDGLRLGAWAGAKVQEYHAIMSHNMGNMFGMGNTPFLFLNRHGKRFMNECVPGQQLEDQLELQPGKILYQFFDSSWREQLPLMPPNHGSMSGYSPVPLGHHLDGVIDEASFQRALEKGVILQSDTLEGLLGQLDICRDAAMESISRYNELARKGHDDDFGKPARRMFPLEKGPFYASSFGLSTMLACIGGLESDEECHVYTREGDILSGLYVAGNVQGCVYAGEYPICARGLSHSICMFYGYIAGKNVVVGK